MSPRRTTHRLVRGGIRGLLIEAAVVLGLVAFGAVCAMVVAAVF